MNFLGGATSLDSFLKACILRETERVFPFEWLDSFEELSRLSLSAYDEFLNHLSN